MNASLTWVKNQYFLRMKKLEYDHMSKFTGKVRTEGRVVHITSEDYRHFLTLENTCESLRTQILIMKSREEEKETLDVENLYLQLMAKRLSRGMDTTIKTFAKSATDRFDKNLKWTRVSTDPRDDVHWRARNQFGEVRGYTLDQEDLDKMAGDRKQALSWIWRSGNFLMTEENEIYYFL